MMCKLWNEGAREWEKSKWNELNARACKIFAKWDEFLENEIFKFVLITLKRKQHNKNRKNAIEEGNLRVETKKKQ